SKIFGRAWLWFDRKRGEFKDVMALLGNYAETEEAEVTEPSGGDGELEETKGSEHSNGYTESHEQ
ncbi:hypothetical protein BBJ28_00027224, partial [Nothophytophthora sp. Chile5]